MHFSRNLKLSREKTSGCRNKIDLDREKSNNKDFSTSTNESTKSIKTNTRKRKWRQNKENSLNDESKTKDIKNKSKLKWQTLRHMRRKWQVNVPKATMALDNPINKVGCVFYDRLSNSLKLTSTSTLASTNNFSFSSFYLYKLAGHSFHHLQFVTRFFEGKLRKLSI